NKAFYNHYQIRTKGWAGFDLGGLGFVYGHGAAKPIPHSPPKSFIAREGTEKVLSKNLSIKKSEKAHIQHIENLLRSEERRVGRDCRWPWSGQTKQPIAAK